MPIFLLLLIGSVPYQLVAAARLQLDGVDRVAVFVVLYGNTVEKLFYQTKRALLQHNRTKCIYDTKSTNPSAEIAREGLGSLGLAVWPCLGFPSLSSTVFY